MEIPASAVKYSASHCVRIKLAHTVFKGHSDILGENSGGLNCDDWYKVYKSSSVNRKGSEWMVRTSGGIALYKYIQE